MEQFRTLCVSGKMSLWTKTYAALVIMLHTLSVALLFLVAVVSVKLFGAGRGVGGVRGGEEGGEAGYETITTTAPAVIPCYANCFIAFSYGVFINRSFLL